METTRFLLSSEESELLLVFERMGNIESTARVMRKDASGVSRQLSAMAQKVAVLEKRNGRWVITDLGKSFNGLAQKFIQGQSKLLQYETLLSIGTNREFAARVMGPQFLNLRKLLPHTNLSIFSFESGTEEALLKGKVDLGIDCGRPYDPAIAYKLILREPILAVCTKKFYQKYEQEILDQQIYHLPHLLCERLYPDKIFSDRNNKLNILASFNDIATVRSVCLTGVGWSVLPRYSIEEELEKGTLVQIEEKKVGEVFYGLWWLRERPVGAEILALLNEWLKQQKL